MIYAIRRLSDGRIMETRTTCKYEGAEIVDGCEAIEDVGADDLKAGGKVISDIYTEPDPDETAVHAKLQALKDIDAGAETGTLKTVVEFLQHIYQ